MTEERLMWFKGELIAPSQALVPVLSPTAQFGLNVFEGIRAYWNPQKEILSIFRLQEHLDRLKQSCRLIGITCPYDQDAITKAIFETIRVNDYHCDAALRITVFVDGEGSWSSSAPVDMFVAPIERPRQPIEDVLGQRACVSTWERINDRSMPPRIKAGANYINGRYAHLEAQRNGHDLPILLTREGNVAEGAGACLFAIRDGVLITPPVTDSMLESITRASLLTLAEDMGLPVTVRSLNRSELTLSDELFLCGSAAELTPLSWLDGLPIGNGSVGAITLQLLARYRAVADGSDSAFGAWRTACPVVSQEREIF